MKNEISRRTFLSAVSAGLGAVSVSNLASAVADEAPVAPVSATLDPNRVRFCLNLGTIRNYELKIKEELEVARDAGYRSVEI